MSGQKDLLFTWHEAADADIKALGGRKKVGARLWPAEDSNTQENRMKASLAPGHLQQFKPLEVLKIKEWAKTEANSTELVDFEAKYLHQQIEWVDPENEAERIDRENHEMLKVILRNQERSEKLRSLRSVK